MNIINQNFEYPDKSFESRLDFRKNILRISDKEIQDKVIYAYFLDRFNPKNERERVAYDSLNKLEWSPGFLSLRSLENLMSRFLKSNYAEQLTYKTLTKLNHFVLLLENAKEHYAEIDLFLSSDIALDLFVSTGNPMMLKLSIPRKLSFPDVEEIVSHCLKRVEALKAGETALFQGGTRTHVAPFTLTLCEDGRYKVNLYNTTSDSSSLLKNLEEVKNFFLKITQHKLDSQLKEGHSRSPLTHFLKEGANSSFTPLRKDQLKNTCHTKGLLTLLFKMIKEETQELQSTSIENSWNDFKTLFGQFILDQEIDRESTLYQLSVLEQKKHAEKSELYHLIKAVTESGSDEMQNNKNEYERLILVYMNDLRSLCFAQKEEYEPKAKDDLIVLHRKLVKVLANIPPEEIEKIAASSPFSTVRKSLKIIADQEKASRQRNCSEIEKQLEELKIENTHFHKIVAGIVKKGHQLFDIKDDTNLELTLKSRLTRRSLFSQELDSYMTFLIENSKELEGIRKKHSIVHLLIQAIEEGRFDDFFKIYENLSEKDQKKLQFYIQRTLSVNPNNIIIPDLNILKKIKSFNLIGNMFNPIIIKTLTHLIESDHITEFKNYFSLIDDSSFQYFSSIELPTEYCKRISEKAPHHNFESLLKLIDLLKEHRIDQGNLHSGICQMAILEYTLLPFIFDLLNKRNDIHLNFLLKIASNQSIGLMKLFSINGLCAHNIHLLENAESLNSFLNFCLKHHQNYKFVDHEDLFMHIYNKISEQTKEKFLLQANTTLEEIRVQLSTGP